MFHFGCLSTRALAVTDGPGTAAVVLILDRNEAGPMAREVLFLVLDTALVVPFESPATGDFGIDEDGLHLTSIFQFSLGLLGLGNLGCDLLPGEKLSVCQGDVDGIH